MKAVSLLVVFLLAKVLILAGRALPLSVWTPLAFLWQDVLAALLFAGLEFATRRRPWIARGVYAAVVLYVAVNVPLACVLSTPLTWPLLLATRGALADSIAYHVTGANVLRLVVVLAAGLTLPWLLRPGCSRMPMRLRATAALTAALLTLLGPPAARRVETLGLHRNVLAALLMSAVPRITAEDLDGDWQRSPFGSVEAEDLSRFRAQARGRNVVVIHLESTAARYLRPYGASEDPMPNLTQLTQQAILFEKAYTVYPETIKSFFAAQCSIYPALDTKPEMYEHVRSPGLATVLADVGYHTGLFHSGRFMYLGMESVLRNRGYHTLEDAGAIGGEHQSSFGIDERSTVRRILAWLDALPRGQPFLVTYLPIAGHHPYATFQPGPFPPAEEINRYRNALHESDAALGELLRGLQARQLDRNTLFVLLGDHGQAFGQHDGNYGHTLFLYDENVHVPLVVAAPGLIQEPIRVGRVASLIDTAPTILDLLGLPAPVEYQGRTLLAGRSRLALFCTDYSLGFLGLRDGRWKMIQELESGRAKLFDLHADPDERQDRSAEFAERIEAYREHLLRWCAAQKYRIMRSRLDRLDGTTGKGQERTPMGARAEPILSPFFRCLAFPAPPVVT